MIANSGYTYKDGLTPEQVEQKQQLINAKLAAQDEVLQRLADKQAYKAVRKAGLISVEYRCAQGGCFLACVTRHYGVHSDFVYYVQYADIKPVRFTFEDLHKLAADPDSLTDRPARAIRIAKAQVDFWGGVEPFIQMLQQVEQPGRPEVTEYWHFPEVDVFEPLNFRQWQDEGYELDEVERPCVDELAYYDEPGSGGLHASCRHVNLLKSYGEIRADMARVDGGSNKTIRVP
ncbi:hypothetical protein F8390_06850 [Corynebacterium sp. 366]|uniref:hypothetical protein n=1 Tax=Corynebacterium sp. 366 TaxID=2652251 RepID=UPI00125CBD84|nr:hypothetical protein [Corynebacterium sp. 366]KAB3538730.1 hypothetical protein F8390_06850 [Corynebacterium sp. 366]